MLPAVAQIDSTLIKAIARGFRWQKMLETGQYATIKEIARAEKINPSYVSGLLRLTLLAPPTVEAILNGRVERVDVALSRRRWRRSRSLGRDKQRRAALTKRLFTRVPHSQVPRALPGSTLSFQFASPRW
jgi:hypothetical protein